MNPIQSPQPFFNIRGFHSGNVGNDPGFELMPLDARGREHHHFVFVQLINAAFDDAARRLWHFATDRIVSQYEKIYARVVG